VIPHSNPERRSSPFLRVNERGSTARKCLEERRSNVKKASRGRGGIKKTERKRGTKTRKRGGIRKNL